MSLPRYARGNAHVRSSPPFHTKIVDSLCVVLQLASCRSLRVQWSCALPHKQSEELTFNFTFTSPKHSRVFPRKVLCQDLSGIEASIQKMPKE